MNIINSIKAHLYERSTSPLAGAFVFSWLGWNYRFVMVLFSDLKLDDKFTYIATLYPNIWDGFWGVGFLYPLLTAICVILLYPLPAIPLSWYSRFMQMKQRERNQKIEKKKLLSVEESQAIILENLKLEEEFSKQIKRKDGEIDALRAEAEKLNQSNSISSIPERKIVQKKKSGFQDLLDEHQHSELSKKELLVLESVTSFGSEYVPRSKLYEYLTDIKSGEELDLVEIDFILGELEMSDMLDKYDERDGVYYSITHTGRAAILEERKNKKTMTKKKRAKKRR